ncbi:non-specific lipid-transfer protein A-like isoform X1 [Juglans microcarpa x Juglans regia]|uniref:non-specific lipid-transfer protein A-like isoform X1 n=1 Tax=Juglans microcarpa x Juglans regia TaxID=2249226 RepID=UPI001B7EBE89|nr:non-specific lipid-transfer protein A-like isoform X1 [Juglans microcarpa x Juglans regia]
MEKKTILTAFGLMMMMLILSATIARADLCQDALTTLLPCMPFLTGSDQELAPSPTCCLGASELLNKATTSDDLKALCVCFKNAAAQDGVKSDRAELLPNLCKIKVPVPIKPDVDCNKL